MKITTLLIGTIILLGNTSAFASTLGNGDVQEIEPFASLVLSQENESDELSTSDAKRIRLRDIQFSGNDNSSHTRCSHTNQILSLLSSDKFIFLTKGCAREFGRYVLRNIRVLIPNYDDFDEIKIIRLSKNGIRFPRGGNNGSYQRCMRGLHNLTILSNKKVGFLTKGCRKSSSGDYRLMDIEAVLRSRR